MPTPSRSNRRMALSLLRWTASWLVSLCWIGERITRGREGAASLQIQTQIGKLPHDGCCGIATDVGSRPEAWYCQGKRRIVSAVCVSVAVGDLRLRPSFATFNGHSSYVVDFLLLWLLLFFDRRERKRERIPWAHRQEGGKPWSRSNTKWGARRFEQRMYINSQKGLERAQDPGLPYGWTLAQPTEDAPTM